MQINRVNCYNNNQKQNNKPAFGMALKRINTAGMTADEKTAIIESISELRAMFNSIDGDIEIKTQEDGKRYFNVLSSTAQKGTIERIAEFFPARTMFVHNSWTKVEDLKQMLRENALSSIRNYKENNNELADTALKAALKKVKKTKTIENDGRAYVKTEYPTADNVITQTGSFHKVDV
jgi:hypothetical protein